MILENNNGADVIFTDTDRSARPASSLAPRTHRYVARRHSRRTARQLIHSTPTAYGDTQTLAPNSDRPPAPMGNPMRRNRIPL